MHKLDIVTIQGKIEEKRLILALKIEKFLLEKLQLLIAFLHKVLSKKSSAFFTCSLVILSSILVRSAIDGGPASALNLWQLHLPIIDGEILVNLLGIFTIIFCYKILKKGSDPFSDPFLLNLLITSIAIGFFWRAYTLQFNEFFTKTSLILALAFPAICYFLVKKNKIDKIVFGLLLLGLVAILFSMIDFENNARFVIFKEDILPVLIILLGIRVATTNLHTSPEKVSDTFLPLSYPVLIYATILLFLFPDNYDNRTIFFSISLPLITLAIYKIAPQINWRRDALMILFILIVPQFDAANFFSIALYFFILWLAIYIFLRPTSFNKVHTAIFFTAISYIASLYLSAIFGYNSPSARYKSPNKISNEILQTINNNKALKTLVVSSNSYNNFSLKNYSKSSIELSSIVTIKNFPDLIFIEKKNYNSDSECKIGVLEEAFKDEEFKKLFLENYAFLNRLTSTKSYQKNIEFFADKEIPNISLDHEIIERDFEVYVRK